MIKFLLVFIAVILMILGIYTYTNQSTEKNMPTPTVSVKKKEVKETEKVSVVAQEVKKQKSSVKNITVKSPKVVSQEPIQETGDEEEIGKGLTLESIENADVSSDERERMLGDYIYRHNIDSNEPAAEIDEDKLLDILRKDILSNN